MARLPVVIGLVAVLATFSPIVAQVAETQSSAGSALPASQSQTLTQAEVNDALKKAQELEGRKRALVTQDVGYWNDPSTGLMWAAKMYLYLLGQAGHPEVRLAQIALGNFVLDGKYSAGDDPRGRALNLEWARIIAQEVLGQEEYKIAIDYGIGREDLPKNSAMWLRFCKRAAAYNIDLAQKFLAQAITEGTVPNQSGFDDVTWTRLASDKQTDEAAVFNAMESRMAPQQRQAADAAYASLVTTRASDGAYYSPDDPLRNPTPAELAAMPIDDPDVQLRRAFAMEKAAQTNNDAYGQALNLYRTIRDRREMDIRFALGRDYLNGTNGLPRSLELARYWFDEAAGFGSQPAKTLLGTLANSRPN